MYNLSLLIHMCSLVLWCRTSTRDSTQIIVNSPSHLIFASLTSLLQQWPNTLYPNGHSLVAGTISAGTLLYHARKDPYPPPRTEWLAFDAEYSYEVMTNWGAETFLNTYVTTRTLRILYIDGGSSVLGETGPLDSQSVLVWGNVSLDKQKYNYQEIERAQGLCKLGEEQGYEGVVRMNAGFELLWCNFDEGLELINRINITDPNSNLDHSFPPPSPSDMSPFSVDQPCQIAPDLCKDRFPHPVTGPFASLGGWERQRASTWHYHWPGETRVVLDLASFVTFYDPRVKSLAEIRHMNGTETKRDKQRILGISNQDVQYMMKQVRDMLERKRAENWSGSGSGLDWRGISSSIVERYGGRLAELRWALRPEVDDEVTAVAIRVRSVTYPLIMPYVDMAAYSTNTVIWLKPAEKRCQLAFTHAVKIIEQTTALTPSEILIRWSIEDVLAQTCSTLIKIFGETQMMDLSTTGPISTTGRLKPTEKTIARWRSEINGLMEWLGWSVWNRCEKQCAWDELCMIPMWPVSGGSPDGRHEDDTNTPIAPKCVRLDSENIS